MARPSSSMFDKSSFETIRPVKKPVADNYSRRFSMMDFPTSFGDVNQGEDQHMPDSPGDAAGALKKMFEGRQKRIGMINESGTVTELCCLYVTNRHRTFFSEHTESTQSTLGTSLR
jgi:hypothetical protein